VSLTLVDGAGVAVDATDVVVDTAGAVDAAGVVADATGVVVESACVVVEPTGVDVSSQPTQAISIALIRMMDLSRCMWPLCSLLSGNGALEVLAQCPESESDERIGVGGQALFPQPQQHELGDVRRLCPGYSIERCWRRGPMHRDKAATLFHGLADRRVLVAGIVPNSMHVSRIGDAHGGCFDHAHLPSLGSEVGWAKLLPEVHNPCNRASAMLTVYGRSGRDLD